MKRVFAGFFGAVLAALPTTSTAAPVYRCEIEGRVVYTDRPCGQGAAPRQLPALVTLPAAPPTELTMERGRREAEAREAHDRESAAWLKAHEAGKVEEARMRAAVDEGRILKGMSADQVRRALGSPDEVERSGPSEEWIYGSGKARQTVAFENGKVVRPPRAQKK